MINDRYIAYNTDIYILSIYTTYDGFISKRKCSALLNSFLRGDKKIKAFCFLNDFAALPDKESNSDKFESTTTKFIVS